MQYSDPSLVNFPWETRDRIGHSYLFCEVALYLLSSCYRLMSAVCLCVSVSEFDGSEMQLPSLSETGPVWYSDPRVYLPYLLRSVQICQGVLLGPVMLEKNDS